MRYLITLLMLFGVAEAQPYKYYMRYDSVFFQTATNSEFILKNATRDSSSGVLVNIGGGITQFKKVRAISATQFVVGSDTVTITGSGGGGGSSAWGGITGTLSNQTDLQTALNGKAALVHTHAQSDVTNLVSDLSGKAATVHTHVISDVTSLQSTIDAKVSDALNNGTTTIAPSQNAVFDILSSQQFARPPSQKIIQSLGSTVLYETLGLSRLNISTSAALADGQLRVTAIYVNEATTLTGARWYQGTTGDYTADNYNGVGLYSFSSGTLTLVASSTNDGNIWKATTNTIVSKDFTTPYAASPGIYFLAYLYNNSAQTTAPTVGVYPALPNLAVSSQGLSNSAKTSSVLASQTVLPTPQAMSGLTGSTVQLYGGLY